MRLKKTPLLAKILILAVCAFALVSLVRLRGQIVDKRTQADDLEKQVMYEEQNQKEMEEERLELEKELQQLRQNGEISREDFDSGDYDAIIKIARERLGMVADGEIVFYDSDNN